MSINRTDKQYDYFAFISYCGSDEKWAKRLHYGLEHYHIPSHLQKEHPQLPSKIRPVFWYKQDLSGTKLRKALQNELDSSRYLIVICSPEAAKAPWVNDEVLNFAEKHDSSNIIPFIVKGVPKSEDPSLECFPQALRNLPMEEELRGINVCESGFQRALVDVVATMFNIRFDALWQRHRRRLLRNRIIMGIIAFILILCGIGSYLYFKTTEEYYASYEICNGMPVGKGTLSHKELKSYMRHYRFEYSRLKLRRVVYCNTFGVPDDDQSSWSQFRSSILELGYENGRLNSITHRDALGKPLFKMVYNDDYTKVDIKDALSDDAASVFKSVSSSSEVMTSQSILDFSKLFNQSRSQIARFVYEYDDNGYIRKIHFKKYNGSNETGFDENGISAIEYERDSDNRMTRRRYLNDRGEYMQDKYGCAGCSYEYDSKGYMASESYFNIEGKPSLCDLSYARSEMTHDAALKKYTEVHYDEEGSLCMTTYRYCKQEIVFDGDSLTARFFAADMTPDYCFSKMQNQGMYHCSKAVFDKHGRIASLSFFNTENQPCCNTLGIHCMKIEYDRASRPSRYSFYNTTGDLCRDNTGVSITEIEYDDYGNVTSSRFYDENHRRTTANGLCERYIRYEGNRPVHSACFDENGMPAYTQINFGVPVVQLKYDDFGNVTEAVRKSGNGTFEGFDDSTPAYLRAEYNAGNCVRYGYYNTSGNLVTGPEGFAELLNDYDSRGHLVRTEYHGVDAKPYFMPNLRYAVIEHTVDSYGNQVESRSYDASGNPVICADGWAIKKSEYNNYLLTRLSAFDEKNRPILTKGLEAHSKEYVYDKHRQIVSERCYGTDSRPVLNSAGVSEVRYKYDNRGIPVEMRFFGTGGEPTNCIYGYHIHRQIYNNRNQVIEERYYNTTGLPAVNSNVGYSIGKNDYDEVGRLLQNAYFDTSGNPIKCSLGYAKAIYRYNGNGRPLYSSFFDEAMNYVDAFYNNMMVGAMYGFYDDKGQILSIVSLDSDLDEVTIGARYDEDGLPVGYLNRQFGLVNLNKINGDSEEIGYSWNTDSMGTVYHNYLDSLVDMARDSIERITESLKKENTVKKINIR